MAKLKKAFRFLCFLLFIILASFGLGIGNVLHGSKERYQDNEIKIEQTDKREEDDEESCEEKS
jgi:hypothetical protein